MKKATLLAVLFFVCHISLAQNKGLLNEPYLETTAIVDTLIQPDEIYLAIDIQEADERNRTSVEEMEAAMIQKLNQLGIDTEKQLTLVDASSNFKKYFLKSKDILKNKTYELKVSSSQVAGKVLLALESIGVSNIDLTRTEYSKMDQLQLVLKSKAVEKAKRQAEFLVKPLNQSVGTAIYILDNSFNAFGNLSNSEQVVITGYSGTEQKEEYQPPAIEFKPIQVEIQVTVRFKID